MPEQSLPALPQDERGKTTQSEYLCHNYGQDLKTIPPVRQWESAPQTEFPSTRYSTSLYRSFQHSLTKWLRVKFSGTIQRRRHPGPLSWLLLAAMLFVATFIPVVSVFALAIVLPFFVSAALGSFLGWFTKGVRDEIKSGFCLKS